jgi:uncharacterized membrane protein YjgN (DUF898 family)
VPFVAPVLTENKERMRGMDSGGLYATLGIASNASAQDITAAYAAALARYRRHLAGGKPLPPEQLDALRHAYQTLSSLDLRRSYDAERKRSVQLAAAAVKPRLASATIPAAESAATEMPVEFRGSGEEYFRIWLVNIALTVLTLGFYSPWAKVRREKYFHRNMLVDGSAFDYHGKPRAILFGRLILLAFFVALSLAENISAAAKLGVLAVGAVAFPWLLVQSMRFRACNTSYRGLRFSFSGGYLRVLVLFLVHGTLSALTLGLYFPVFLQRQKAFIARHLSYGNTPVQFSGGVGAFYRGLAFPLLVWILLLIGAALAALPLFAGGKIALALAIMLYALPLIGGMLIVMQLILLPYARVVGTNLLWNHMSVGGTRFRSTQKVRSYIGIMLSNWALTLLTLGFFWPLGQIRLARFRAGNLHVIAPQRLAAVLAGTSRERSALGSESMAALDIDIAL